MIGRMIRIYMFFSFFLLLSLAHSFMGPVADDGAGSSISGDGGASPAIKGIIFDLDGTLLDTEKLADEAIISALNVHPFCEGGRLPWEIKGEIIGLKGSDWSTKVVEYFEGRCRDDPLKSSQVKLVEPRALLERWERLMIETCGNVKAMPGAKMVVDGFHASGVPMGIATSCHRDAFVVSE